MTLREKIQDLEAKFKELVAYGTENDQISEKVHRSTLALFAAPDLETTLAVLYHSLKEDFGVPQVAARLWGKVPEQSYLHELAATSSEIRQYADQLGQPYCGPVAAFESREWFEDGDMCAIGQYENVNHSTEKSSTAENLMRSANAPTISATVMAANVAWNAK